MKRLAPMLSGTASLRAALLPAAVLLSIGLLLAAGCSKDEDSVAFPVAPEEPPYLWYYDVYGTSANDVWVVGNLGMMYHYDGATWRRDDLGTQKAITCLYGASDGSVFAAGYGGSVWRNAGSGWTGMSTGTSKDLYGMGLYKGDLHAVGQDGAALRYDGGSNSWHALPGIMVTRNAKEGNAVVDTLYLDADVVTLKVVNHYMIGGAFFQPDWPTDPEPQGLEGTVGFYIADDTPIVCSAPECVPAVDETGLYEPRIVQEIAGALPEPALLYTSNSMPVRELDAFLPLSGRGLRILSNRGANGIDGMVSSALGAAAADTAPVVLLTGDLAFLHDLGGLAALRRHRLRAIFVVLNNDGGGIFSRLPIAAWGESVAFDEHFRTPHGLDLSLVAALFGASFARVTNVDALRAAVSDAFANDGASVIEVPLDPDASLLHRRAIESAVDRALATRGRAP